MSLFYKCPIKALLNEHFNTPDCADLSIWGSEEAQRVVITHTPTGKSLTLNSLSPEATQLSHEYQVFIDTVEALPILECLHSEDQGMFAIDTHEQDTVIGPYGEDGETLIITTLSKQYTVDGQGSLYDNWVIISEAEYGHELEWTLYDDKGDPLAEGTIGDEE